MGDERSMTSPTGTLPVPQPDATVVADGRTDLRQVAAEVKSSLSRTLTLLGGNVEIGPLPRVRGDARQLERLLQNLLGNAIKFRRPGRPPQVIVTAVQAGDWVTVRVDDNGIGMAPEQRERPFHLVQRRDLRDAGPEGGIGLAVAQQIVELTGGRIWADDSPLGGARLSCTLPAAAGDPA
jgi:signal transduction histidine kinase